MKMNGILRKLIVMALPFLIKKGTDYVAKRGTTTTTTAGSKQLQTSARSTAKRARQAAKVTRKMR